MCFVSYYLIVGGSELCLLVLDKSVFIFLQILPISFRAIPFFQ
jgi:hypothetical protein